MVVSDPTTPVEKYGPYDETDINKIEKGNNTFEDRAHLKYRLEFDVLKPEEIAKMKVFFDYNLFNKDGVKIYPDEMKLKKADGTLLETYTTDIHKEEGNNRYYINIDKSKVNNVGRYFIEYEGKINIQPDHSGTQDQITNKAKIKVFSTDSNIPKVISGEYRNRKLRINTKITRQAIIYD